MKNPEWREYFQDSASAFIHSLELALAQHDVCEEGRVAVYAMFMSALRLAEPGVTPTTREGVH